LDRRILKIIIAIQLERDRMVAMKRNPFKRRITIKSGSQTSEPIELTDYVIVQKRGNEIILRDTVLNKRELWTHNQNFAGYCIRIGKKNFEFVSSLV
jgi:hypothetical protein